MTVNCFVCRYFVIATISVLNEMYAKPIHMILDIVSIEMRLTFSLIMFLSYLCAKIYIHIAVTHPAIRMIRNATQRHYYCILFATMYFTIFKQFE